VGRYGGKVDGDLSVPGPLRQLEEGELWKYSKGPGTQPPDGVAPGLSDEKGRRKAAPVIS